MLHKTLRVICIYLIAMCIVSAFKWVFSDVPLLEDTTGIPTQSGTTTSRTVTKEAPTITQEIASPTTETSSTYSSPPMTIKVEVVKDEHVDSKHNHTSNLVLKTVPPDIPGTMLSELEKRKKFIVRICMRRFCRAYIDR